MSTGTPAPPFYDNIRDGGPDGIRKPKEVGKAGYAINQFVTINASSIGGSAVANTIALVPTVGIKADVAGSGIAAGAEASYIVVTGGGSGATILTLPGAFPGHRYVLYNNTGGGSNVTLKVAGLTGIAVADTKHALLICNATDIVRVTADT